MTLIANIHGLFLYKVKKGITMPSAFQKILKESNRKPNKIWVDKGREFYKRSMKSWLGKHDIGMYLTHNDGKSVIKNKIYKYMNSIPKNVYMGKIDDVANKYYSTIKITPVDVKANILTLVKK